MKPLKRKINRLHLFLGVTFLALPLAALVFNVGLLAIYKFALAVTFLFYIPGTIILKAIKLKISSVTHATFALILGLFISSEISKIFFYLGIQKYLWVLFAAAALYFFISSRRSIKNKIRENFETDMYTFFLVALCLVMTFVIWYSVFPSGRLYADGMRFFRANAFDSMNQWAISEELARPLPRQLPFWSGEPMTGYHIGAYYWRGLLLYLTRMSPIELFLRLSPLFSKNLAVLAVFAVVKEMKQRKVAIFAALSVFFLGDMSWFLAALDRLFPMFDIKTLYFHSNILQPFVFNPPLVWGILAISGGIFFLKEATDKKSLSCTLFSGYFFGTLFSSKVFFGIVFFLSLFILGGYEIAKKRDFGICKIFLTAVLVSAIEAGSMFKLSSGGIFRLDPFYFPAYMLNEANFFKKPDFTVIGQYGLAKALGGLAVFTIGSIGIKMPAFVKIGSYVKNFRFSENHDRLLIISLAPSFVLTHLFTFNTLYRGATINFYVVFLFVLGIYFAEWLADSLRNKSFFGRGAILGSVFVYALGTVYFSVMAYTPKYNRYKRVSPQGLEALDFVRRKTPQNALVIHNRSPLYWYREATESKDERDIEGRDCFVSSIGGRRVVLECDWHVGCGKSVDNYNEALKSRKNDIQDFFSTADREKAADILKKYGVSHVWVEGPGDLKFRKKDILKKVFSNETVAIYEVVD